MGLGLGSNRRDTQGTVPLVSALTIAGFKAAVGDYRICLGSGCYETKNYYAEQIGHKYVFRQNRQSKGRNSYAQSRSNLAKCKP
jgi:hypothetical protein